MSGRTVGDGSERLRLFVACELPDEATRALGRLQEDLRRAGLSGLRWVRPEGVHITLKFLGEVESARVGPIEAALREAVRPFSFTLRLARLGTFGGRRMRVLWVGLEGDVAGLRALAEAVDRALGALDFPSEERPFAAHVTLARVPDQTSSSERQRLAGLVERYRLPALPSVRLEEVSLMRSVLGPGGARYERLASFPGAAPAEGEWEEPKNL